MTCDYCRSVNAEDDHRCRRCGRRLMGSAVEASPEYSRRALQAVGATALAAATAELKRPQPALFLEEPAQRKIPFERSEMPETAEMFALRAAKGKTATARKPATDSTQTKLDFLPPAAQTTRMLKTTVEANIYCDAAVASPVHRATAAAIDGALIGASCVLFYAIFRVFGGAVAWNKDTVPVFAGAFVLIALLYGFCWLLADTETAGMRWTDLKILGFNGFPPERKTRALRMAGCFLSFCSGMIGILWALVDEEGLTWHDHMSKTFPTLRDTGSHLVRH